MGMKVDSACTAPHRVDGVVGGDEHARVDGGRRGLLRSRDVAVQVEFESKN
jgi:hypothetical protein